jgi:hypothetical protein
VLRGLAVFVIGPTWCAAVIRCGQAAEDSLLKFLKTGVGFALEAAPRNLRFLEGMRPYIARLSEGEWPVRVDTWTA